MADSFIRSKNLKNYIILSFVVSFLISIFLFSTSVFAQKRNKLKKRAVINSPSVFPSLLSTIRNIGPVNFCGEPAPINDPEMRERLEKELMLFLWDRPQIILWVKRSGRYMPYVEKMLEKNNMPDDLKYVAIVESALLPHIGSSKWAIGYWQFIKSTGLKYGLRIDKNIDERRNIYTSTNAAIKYFKKLYGDFGSWTLAAAAYNMGEQGLKRRIAEQKTNDYYHLYLPLETQRYIFKILAVKLIFSDLHKYGFDFVSKDLYPPKKFDRVNIELSVMAPIQFIAEASGTYFKTIKDLNPEIRGSYLPKGSYMISIPKGAAKNFHAKLAALLKAYKPRKKASSRGKVVYTVRRGDSLTGISRKFRISLNDLLRWNKLRINSNIQPGQKLVIMK